MGKSRHSPGRTLWPFNVQPDLNCLFFDPTTSPMIYSGPHFGNFQQGSQDRPIPRPARKEMSQLHIYIYIYIYIIYIYIYIFMHIRIIHTQIYVCIHALRPLTPPAPTPLRTLSGSTLKARVCLTIVTLLGRTRKTRSLVFTSLAAPPTPGPLHSSELAPNARRPSAAILTFDAEGLNPAEGSTCLGHYSSPPHAQPVFLVRAHYAFFSCLLSEC